MDRIPILIFITLMLFSATFSQTGKISGKLTYPGDSIPSDLVVCVTVTSLYSEPTFCSNDAARRLRDAKIAFKVNRSAASYSVTVPPGSYYVCANTAEMPGVRAYYNEFVRCGMSVNCHSTERIQIKVAPGRTRAGITVGDFWN